MPFVTMYEGIENMIKENRRCTAKTAAKKISDTTLMFTAGPNELYRLPIIKNRKKPSRKKLPYARISLCSLSLKL